MSAVEAMDDGRLGSGKKQPPSFREEVSPLLSTSNNSGDHDSLETVGSEAQQIVEEDHLRPDGE